MTPTAEIVRRLEREASHQDSILVAHLLREAAARLEALQAEADRLRDKLAFCKSAHAELVRRAGGVPPAEQESGALSKTARSAPADGGSAAIDRTTKT